MKAINMEEIFRNISKAHINLLDLGCSWLVLSISCNTLSVNNYFFSLFNFVFRYDIFFFVIYITLF